MVLVVCGSCWLLKVKRRLFIPNLIKMLCAYRIYSFVLIAIVNGPIFEGSIEMGK